MVASAEIQESKSNSVIKRWLAERSELLVLYCRLTGKRNALRLPEPDQISQFCDILIDYVSAGHFEVYEQMVSMCDQHGPSSLALLEDIFPQISKTTDIVVDFNDKYAQGLSSEQLIKHLDKDLSMLGEAIASRVELEDRLINTLSTHH
ncbi:MAG: sigma D regulator [Kangiellaceae bacterium]|jgi:regulator of sigma D|nr:sigma D regulator [Kangiellaceae bacterium]